MTGRSAKTARKQESRNDSKAGKAGTTESRNDIIAETIVKLDRMIGKDGIGMLPRAPLPIYWRHYAI